MKQKAFLTTILIALLFASSTTWADDAVVVAETTYELKLSKTLTLNPSGRPVEVTPVVPVELTTPRTQPPQQHEGDSTWWVWLLLGAGALASWVAFRLGARSQIDLGERQAQQLAKANGDISTLKQTLIESGSGPRQEWQSSLESMRTALREKNQHIDSLHDNSKNQLVELQHASESVKAHQAELDAQAAQNRADIEKLEKAQAQRIEKTDRAHQQSQELIEKEHQKKLQDVELALRNSKNARDVLQDQHTKALSLRESQQLQQHEEREKQHRQQLADDTAALSSSQKEVDTLRTQLEQYKSNADRDRSAAKDEIAQLRVQLRQAENDKNDSQLSTDQMQQRIDAFSQTQETADQTITGLTQEKHTLLAQVEKLDTYEQSQKTLLDEQTVTIDNLNQTIVTLTDDLAQLQSRYAENVSKADQLQETHASTQKKLDDLALKHTELSSDAQSSVELVDSLALQNAEIEKYTADLNALQEQRQELKEQLVGRDSDLETVVSELESLRLTNKQLEEKLLHAQDDEAKQVDVNRITAHSQELEENLRAGQEQLDAERKAKDHLEEQVVELNAALDKAKTNASDKDSQIDTLRLELKAIDHEKAEIDAQLEKTVDELLEASQARDDQSGQLHDVQKQLQKFQDEATSTQKELNSLIKKQEELEAQHNTASIELLKTQDQLAHKTELLYARDGRLEEMVGENTQQADQVRKLKGEQVDFSDTIAKLEDQLNGAEKDRLGLNAELQQALDTATQESQRLVSQLEESASEKDGLNKQVAELEARLKAAEDEVDHKNMRVLQLGTELVDYKSNKEQYLQDMAKMEDQLTDFQAVERENKPNAGNEVQLNAAIRARDNIVEALEHQSKDADATIRDLKKHIEDLQLSLAVGRQEHRSQPTNNASEAMVDQLRNSLAEKTHIITTLQTDLKVHKDLVKVFENDSIALQKTEEDLETITETKTFLEKELTNAVNEVNALKQRLSKANIVAERRKNIGRTPSEETKQHQQLLYRLAALEAENKQQLELINTLKTDDGLAN